MTLTNSSKKNTHAIFPIAPCIGWCGDLPLGSPESSTLCETMASGSVFCDMAAEPDLSKRDRVPPNCEPKRKTWESEVILSATGLRTEIRANRRSVV